LNKIFVVSIYAFITRKRPAGGKQNRQKNKARITSSGYIAPAGHHYQEMKHCRHLQCLMIPWLFNVTSLTFLVWFAALVITDAFRTYWSECYLQSKPVNLNSCNRNLHKIKFNLILYLKAPQTTTKLSKTQGCSCFLFCFYN